MASTITAKARRMERKSFKFIASVCEKKLVQGMKIFFCFALAIKGALNRVDVVTITISFSCPLVFHKLYALGL